MSPRRQSRWDFSCILRVQSGGVSIKLIYWQLKPPHQPPLPPLPQLPGQLPPEGRPRPWQPRGLGQRAVLLHLLFGISPPSTCPGVVLGSYHCFWNHFPQRCREAPVAGWVLAHGGSLGSCHRGGLPAALPLAKTPWNAIPDPLISGRRITTCHLARNAGFSQIWLFYGLELACWWLRGFICALEVPLGRAANTSSECTPLGFLSLLRKSSENLVAKALLSLGSHRGVSVAPSRVLAVPFRGRGRADGGLQPASCWGEHKMEAALAGPPACHGRTKPRAPASWKNDLLLATCFSSVEGIVSFPVEWFWILNSGYFFSHSPEGSGDSTPCEILLVNY